MGVGFPGVRRDTAWAAECGRGESRSGGILAGSAGSGGGEAE